MAVLDDEFLGQGVTQTHVHTALDLTLQQRGVDDLAHIVRRDDFGEATVVVQQRHLRGPGIGEVHHRLCNAQVAQGRRPVDFELAVELVPGQGRDRGAAQLLAQLCRGVDDRAPSEHRGARGRRLASVQLVLRVDADTHLVDREAELLAGDLPERGVAPLSHLGPGVVKGYRAVGLGPQDGSPVLGEAVANPRVLDAAGDPRVPRAPIGIPDGEEGLLQADAGPQLLSCAEPVADVERVAPPDLPSVDSDALRQAVEHPFDGEVRLVGAEPTHRPAWRVVRVDGARLDVDIRRLVRAAGVAGGALEYLVADARVRAGVTDHARPDRDEVPGLVAPHRVLHGDRMSLHVEAQALLTAEGDAHRTARGPGEQRRVALDIQVLLRAERPAAGDQIGRA